MSNKTYDRIKMVALIIAPVIVFVSAVLKVWDVPYTAEITATLAALDVLVGSVVTVLSNSYKKEDAE